MSAQSIPAIQRREFLVLAGAATALTLAPAAFASEKCTQRSAVGVGQAVTRRQHAGPE